MIKKIDTNATLSITRSGTSSIIDYTHTFSSPEKDGVKINQALIKLHTDNNPYYENGFQVNFIKNGQEEVIDFFKQVVSNCICIDITNELQDTLKTNSNLLRFEITNSSGISFSNTNSEIIINYTSKKKFNSKSTKLDVYAKRAGSGFVNLGAGNIKLNHIDFSSGKSIPLTISHTYNSLLANKNNEEILFDNAVKSLPSFNCGKGWKLNVQQFLVQENKDSKLLDTETSSRFTYFDADGNQHIFNEKFFYKNSSNPSEKIYVDDKDIEIKSDGHYYTNETLLLEKEIISESGFILTDSIENIKGSYLFAAKPKELLQVENQIEQLNKTLDSLQENQKYITKQLISFAFSKKIGINSQNNTIVTTDDIIKIILNKANDEQLTNSDRQRYKFIEILPKLNSYDEDNNGISMDESHKFDVDLQINTYKLNYENNEEEKLAYEKQLEKLKLSKKDLLSQIPVHYISDNEGNVLGFGKILLQDENDNTYSDIYRLILVLDNYNNAICLSYDEDNKLTNIINSNEQEVILEYNENDLISSIIDDKNRTTKFEYTNNYLSKITYPSNEFSEYTYNENGLLISAIEPSGYGFKIDYTNSQVTNITEIASKTNISKNGTISCSSGTNQIILNNVIYDTKNKFSINYYDVKSTIVKNEMSKKSITYIFDNLGNVTNIYENKFENGSIVGNVSSTTYNRINNKKSFIIEPLSNVENLLNNSSFTGYSFITNSELYLGDDLYFGDEIFLSTFNEIASNNQNTDIYILNDANPNANKLEMIVSNNKLNLIKNGSTTDYILSGWAKADSAFVIRRSTDYSDDNEEDFNLDGGELNNLLVQHSDEFKQNRRFELRAELKYTKNGIQRTEKQYCSFDWMNTGWQHCSMPVTLSEDPEDVLDEIKVFFDYSNNTNTAEFFGISLKEGKWEYAEYNDEGLKAYSENSLNNSHTTYEYEDKKLVKTTTTKNGTDYITTYNYNSQGALVRTIDFNGIVTENEYNDKGKIIKSYIYHKDEPASKLYSTEEMIDEKGQSLGEFNELGDKLCEYEYITGTNLTSLTKDIKGNKTAYGYDATDDTLLNVSTTIENEQNSNTYGYNFDLLTSLTHNDMEYNFEYDGFGRQTKVKVLDSNYITTTYEEIKENQFLEDNTVIEVVVGEKITNTLANGEIFITSKNNDGNVTKVQYKQNLTVQPTTLLENFYDTYGNLNQTKDYTNSTTTTYNVFFDKFGNINKKTYTQNNVDVEIESYRDTNNNISSETFKLGNISKTTSFGYTEDLDNKLEFVTLPNGIEQNIEYDKLQRVKATDIGGFYRKNYSFVQKGDHASNLIASEWFGTNGITKESLKYNYDEKGNITSVKENGQTIASYEYDSLSRLIREDNKKLNKTTTFSYDKGGNIIDKYVYPYSTLETEKLSNGTRIAYEYPVDGWKDQLKSFNGLTCEYDSIGNSTTYKGLILSWSHGRQLDEYNGISFGYNASGIRTSKTVNNITTQFYLDGNRVLAQDNGNKLFFNYGVDGIVDFTYEGVGDFYYKKNIQGDIIGIIDINGQEIAKYDYDAWGNHKILVLNNGTFVDISENANYTASGLNNKIIAELNPIRYRGYYYDSETGLYYLNSRYYDPETGRFINADDISYLSPNEFNGLNLYAYCVNNPVMLSDENGTAWWHWLIGAIVVIGAAIAVVATAGGALLGMGAVSAVLAGGSALTVGATVSAGIFIGASTAFAAFGIVAGINSIGTMANGGTFGDALNTFSDYGETAMWSTFGGGILGGLLGYFAYKEANTFTGAKTPGKSTPYSTYKNTKGQTITHYNKNGEMWWSKHLTDHGFANHSAPHWHLEMPHSKNYNNIFSFTIEFIKRLFGGW